MSYHYYFKDGKQKVPILIAHFLCLQTSHCLSFSQRSSSAQEFLNSILKLIGITGSSPNMVICDQGPEIKAVSRKIRAMEASYPFSETQNTKKIQIDFNDYILAFTDREKNQLVSTLGKMSCMLIFHPANSSFLTACENTINQFRNIWDSCQYGKLKLDIFSFNTAVSLTGMALNKQPLFLINSSDSGCYEICAQDLFTGRVGDFSGDSQMPSLHPLAPDNVLSHLSELGRRSQEAFEIFHSERFHKLISFYKDNKTTQYTKLLNRAIEVGDICLFSQRGSKILKLCEVTALSTPGIPQYSQPSEALVTFLPQNYNKVSENIESIWSRSVTKVHLKNLAPIMSRQQKHLDLTILPDHSISPQIMQNVNSEIKKFANTKKPEFWTKLVSTDLLVAPISRILINETSPGNKDPYYAESRKVLAGLAKPRKLPPSNAEPREIMKNLLPDFENPPRPEPRKTDPLSRTSPPERKLASLPSKSKLTNPTKRATTTSEDPHSANMAPEQVDQNAEPLRRSTRTKRVPVKYLE